MKQQPNTEQKRIREIMKINHLGTANKTEIKHLVKKILAEKDTKIKEVERLFENERQQFKEFREFKIKEISELNTNLTERKEQIFDLSMNNKELQQQLQQCKEQTAKEIISHLMGRILIADGERKKVFKSVISFIKSEYLNSKSEVKR